MADNCGVIPFKKKTISELLDLLEVDFGLLKSGDWIPDDDSCDCSLETVERIRDLVGMVDIVLAGERP